MTGWHFFGALPELAVLHQEVSQKSYTMGSIAQKGFNSQMFKFKMSAMPINQICLTYINPILVLLLANVTNIHYDLLSICGFLIVWNKCLLNLFDSKLQYHCAVAQFSVKWEGIEAVPELYVKCFSCRPTVGVEHKPVYCNTSWPFNEGDIEVT